MERLTNHEMDDYNEAGCDLCSAYCYEMCKEDNAVNDCAQRLRNIRLAAYEDIGAPEQIAAWKEADDEGRLAELPCKVGEPVYWFWHDGTGKADSKIFEENVLYFSVRNGQVEIVTKPHDGNIGAVGMGDVRYIALTREAALEAQGEGK